MSYSKNVERRRLRKLAKGLIATLRVFPNAEADFVARVLEVDPRYMRKVVKQANAQLAGDGLIILRTKDVMGATYKLTARGADGLDFLCQGKLNLQPPAANGEDDG